MSGLEGAWLVGVDLQRIFVPPSPWGAPAYARAAAGVERLLPAFGGRVVLTRFVAPAEPRGAWIPYYEQWPFALVPPDDPLYDLTPPFAELDARVETRETFGKWDARLAAAVEGSAELVLGGVSTDCCVLSTALAAADAGVHVRVVADACAGVSDADHERALAVMALYAPLVEITTVAAILGAA